MRAWMMAGVVAVVCLVAPVPGQTRPGVLAGPLLHAHNCYPDLGRGADRLARALSTGVRPIAIEQDLVWNGRQPVVSHGAPLSGDEPSLEAHFFEAVAPLMRAALARPEPDRWPLVVLHLDFKTHEPAHHQAVWDLLGRYEAWLTTAPKVGGQGVQPMRRGPLLVLTEDGEGQRDMFELAVPVGSVFRLFGTVPVARLTTSSDRETQLQALIDAAPDRLLPSGATTYRRWANFPWAVIEHGGPPRAGEWTAGDRARLKAVVDRAHDLGLWIRFYTLNGHSEAENQGWSAGYNFGSRAAVERRWRAVIEAGVDLVTTDQYEAVASLLVRP